jgi:hypothetical protein
MIREKIATDRWTFTFLVPRQYRSDFISRYGIAAGNVQEWDETSKQGTEEAFVVNTQAYSRYFTMRSKGVKSTDSFYADLQGISAKSVSRKMAEISSDVKFIDTKAEITIQELVEKATRKKYVKGTAFYQLIKPEKEVQAYKLIAIRNKTSKKVYAGSEAREMLGINVQHTIKLIPGNHGNWDIFIQSTSNNRKIKPGMQVMVWPEAINY